MISILHTADWQIGRVFSQFEPDDAAALSEARFAVVERLAAIATDRGVDAILVAGDVFDAQTVSDKTIRRLFNAMQGFTGTWVLLPGNHDAALAESVWSRAQRLGAVPGNVIVCLEPKPVVVTGKFTLLPAPLTQRHTYVDLTEWFAAHISTDDLPRIGLAHGSVQGILPEDVDSANPIAAGRAQGAGLTYLALGDWHGTKRVDGKTWYAGTPESERFKANESGQALLVGIEAATLEPVVTAIPTGKFGWRQIEQQMAVDSDVDEVVRMLEAVGGSDVLHVRLSGTCNLAGHRKLSASLGTARAKARAVLWDTVALKLEPTEEDIQALQADGFVGEALQELREQQVGTEPELARDAILTLARILDDQGPGRGAGA
ncbi:DNA repair exonuclease [Xanthomonas citri pv. glycines]|uniref:Metallophosphatase n=2 Tax=Xanthomonas TaxID=338 RepID=A0AAX0I093_XANCG|nr:MULTISPECIES: DNA repair exonuclease [Xanthomonas]AOY62479.1 DNA repair exonuclease [Xanthomonas citri pv. glycines str. 8ra]ARV23810.1 metallophosphatase [Xanthomonas citri pv. glycines str. 12-2]OEY90256.1 metallophosphatase [Xanthomonas citri pv. glycines]OOW84195.1 metallophosphatase [Xanthomonas axonopodis pv. clitoriae]OOX06029.1 metallophosphatase [Xanthomonas citri pv. glycines]